MIGSSSMNEVVGHHNFSPLPCFGSRGSGLIAMAIAAALGAGCSDNKAAGTDAGTSADAGVNRDAGETVLPREVTVALIPQEGVSGMQLVNFAVPLAKGALQAEADVEVLVDGAPIAAYRRACHFHGYELPPPGRRTSTARFEVFRCRSRSMYPQAASF